MTTDLSLTNSCVFQMYKDVLHPTDIQRDMPLDRQRTVRVYSKERARVGGISVKDHFEINVVPLTIGITAHFHKKMMAFAFPEKDPDQLEEEQEVEKKSKKKNKKSKNTSFYVQLTGIEKVASLLRGLGNCKVLGFPTITFLFLQIKG